MGLETYKGNNQLKRQDVALDFSKEEVEEFIKCSKDVIYFASHYIKVVHPDRGLIPIDLYDYQLKLLDHLNTNRHSLVLAARQSGKCLVGSSELIVKDMDTGEIKPMTIEDIFNQYIQ